MNSTYFAARDGPIVTIAGKKYSMNLVESAARNGTLARLIASNGGGGGRARSFNRPISKRYATRSRRRVRGPYAAMTYGQRHTNPVYPRPEVKFYDIGITFTIPNGPSFVGSICYNSIAQGLGGSNRIGLSVSVKSFSYKMNLDLPLAATGPTNVRVIVFWDKQSNGAQPGVTDLLTAANINSFLSMAYKERFTVLRNHYCSLSPNGTQTIFLDEYIKINMQSQYTDAGTIPRTGSIYMCYGSDSTAATNDVVVTVQGRCRYLDN